MPIRVAMIAPALNHFAPWLVEQVQVPIEVRTTPTIQDEDACPALVDAEIAVTNYWTTAMGDAATRLRLIQLPGAGYDKLDPGAIPPGVLVANCYEHEPAIAEHVMMMCLALSRRLLDADRRIRQGNWRYFPGIVSGILPELGGRTIGLIGVGRIGRAVARLAAAFGMRRVGVDAIPVSADVREALGLEWVGGPEDLDRLLSEADFVVTAVPLNEQTRGMLGARELRLLKPSGYLINPARAELIDERALCEALRDRVFAGAALDPWWHYPKVDECVAPSRYPFADLDNVIMTPHSSANTAETFERRMRAVAANLNRFLRGDNLLNVVRELSRAT